MCARRAGNPSQLAGSWTHSDVSRVGSESLDQDSTVIIPGVEPPSPSRWKCDPHAVTLPMSHTPQPQVQTLNARDITPPRLVPPPRYHSEALAYHTDQSRESYF